jgi:hypothetical protein
MRLFLLLFCCFWWSTSAWLLPGSGGTAFAQQRTSRMKVQCEPAVPWDLASYAFDTSSRKPLVLLDVDGVLNNCDSGECPDEMRTVVNGFHIRYSPTIVSAFNNFARDGLAEVRWLTAWGLRARKLLSPALGIDDFLTARDDGWEPTKGIVAKTIADASPDRPIVWVDDELFLYAQEDMQFWKARPNTLMVEPRSHLTFQEVEQISEFLHKYKAST